VFGTATRGVDSVSRTSLATIVDQDMGPESIRVGYPDLSRAALSLSRHLSPQRDSAA
jgi:hypothetical protein